MTELGEFDPFSINSRGDIARARALEGDARQVDPLIYLPGKGITVLPRPKAMPLGVAFGISNDGRCAGVVGDLDSDLKAALWERGKVRLLSQGLSLAYAVNGRGQAVGMAQRSRIGEAVLWSDNREVFLSDTLSRPEGDLLTASSINEQGRLVAAGWNAARCSVIFSRQRKSKAQPWCTFGRVPHHTVKCAGEAGLYPQS